MPRKHSLPSNAQDNDQPKTKRQKLTDSQLERKRELDREAQRTIRERTKNHIAHLEGLVEKLQGEQGDQVKRLVKQLNESRAEINRLRDALASIVKISTAVVEETTGSAPTGKGVVANRRNLKDEPSPKDVSEEQREEALQEDPAEPTSVQIDEPPPPVLPSTPDPIVAQTQPILDAPPDSSAWHNTIDLDTYSPFETKFSARTSRDEKEEDIVQTCTAVVPNIVKKQMSISQMAASILSDRTLEGRYWYLAGVLLSHILKTQYQDNFISFINDEDIAIRAVFEGWSAVLERYPLDRGWQWLKEVDETIYFNYFGPAERLMHLRNCRYQFLHQLYPDAGWNHNLPAFFAARPSQQYLEHDPLIEHFPWPSFRERLLFSPRKFATDKFMDAIRKNVQFTWNYDFNDLYQKDSFTGLYSYSDLFMKYIVDIKCYTVKPKFFEEFPELKSDIPWNSDPSPLSLFSSRFSVASSGTESTGRLSPARIEDAEDDQLQGPLSAYSDSHVWQLGWDSSISPSYVKELQAA